MNEEVTKSLSPFELHLSKIFTKIEIRGKRGRKVLLLMTKAVEKGIDILIQLRADVGVSEGNPYIFPCIGNGSLKNIRWADAI